jgi:hypothetical protein
VNDKLGIFYRAKTERNKEEQTPRVAPFQTGFSTPESPTARNAFLASTTFFVSLRLCVIIEQAMTIIMQLYQWLIVILCCPLSYKSPYRLDDSHSGGRGHEPRLLVKDAKGGL